MALLGRSNRIAYVRSYPKTRELERARDAKYALDTISGPQQSTRALNEPQQGSGSCQRLDGTVFAYGQTSSGETQPCGARQTSQASSLWQYRRCSPS